MQYGSEVMPGFDTFAVVWNSLCS